MKLITPSVRPRALIGTVIAERRPSSLIRRMKSTSGANGSITDGEISGISSGSPVFMTRYAPVGAAGSGG
jgi:hypothetical protein